MEITVYVVNNITDEHIHRFFTEDVLVPDVNDTIGFSSIGDFVVARREFGYLYDDEYGYDVLDYIIDFDFLKLIYEYIMFNQEENVL